MNTVLSGSNHANNPCHRVRRHPISNSSPNATWPSTITGSRGLDTESNTAATEYQCHGPPTTDGHSDLDHCSQPR